MTRQTTQTPITPDQIPAGWRLDVQGRLVHESHIREVDLLMDQTVRGLIERVKTVSVEMAALKADLLGDLDAFAALVAEKYQARLDGASGSLSLTTYDGLLKIDRDSGDRIAVGPEIHAAEALVREILDEIDDPVAKAVADRAFRRNAKTGQLSVSRLQDLIGADIPDERWERAVKAVRESLRCTDRVTYFRAYRRDKPDERWVQIPLDFSVIVPAKPTAQEAANVAA
jgi:hypothetical protein